MKKHPLTSYILEEENQTYLHIVQKKRGGKEEQDRFGLSKRNVLFFCTPQEMACIDRKQFFSYWTFFT